MVAAFWVRAAIPGNKISENKKTFFFMFLLILLVTKSTKMHEGHKDLYILIICFLVYFVVPLCALCSKNHLDSFLRTWKAEGKYRMLLEIKSTALHCKYFFIK